MRFTLKNFLNFLTSSRLDHHAKVAETIDEDSIQDYSDTKNIGLKNHLDFLSSNFDFLIDENNFKLKTNRFYSREFWTTYTNDIIDVKIMFESGSELPWIFIEKCNNPENCMIIREYNDRINSIIAKHKERIEPLMKKFLQNNYDSTELNNDYIEIGQFEHKEYMRESAMTIRELLQNGKSEINAL